MSSLGTMDFDGDALNYIKGYGEIANESVHRIINAKTFEEKCELIVQLTDISKRQMRNMSLRRKKIIVRRYSKLSGCYDVTSGLLVSSYKWKHKNVSTIPLIMRFIEKTGQPFDNFMKEWVKSL